MTRDDDWRFSPQMKPNQSSQNLTKLRLRKKKTGVLHCCSLGLISTINSIEPRPHYRSNTVVSNVSLNARRQEQGPPCHRTTTTAAKPPCLTFGRQETEQRVAATEGRVGQHHLQEPLNAPPTSREVTGIKAAPVRVRQLWEVHLQTGGMRRDG